jgi:MoaA/NifB/PqqE/SkfB family radical SAM enzyme
MIKDTLLGAAAAFLKTERVLNSPLNVQVEPSTHCNLKCRMCIRSDVVSAPAHMAENVFHLVVKKLNPSLIVFAGAGEPLMNPALPSMIRYCSGMGIKTMLSTNLIFGRDVIDRIVEAGVRLIKVSVDAPDAATYGLIRDQGDFGRLSDNLRYLVQKKDRPELRIEYVLMKENFEKVPEMIGWTGRMGVRKIYFRELQTEGIGEARRRALLAGFDFDRLRAALARGRKKAAAEGITTNLAQLLRDFNTLTDVYNRQNRVSVGASCLLPWLNMFVAVNGDLSPCCALYTNGGIKSGNIIDNSRTEILNGAAIACIRRGFRQKKISPVCRDCIPRNFSKLFAMFSTIPEYF